MTDTGYPLSDLYISPKYSRDDLMNASDPYEMSVNVFEDRTNGWFFDHVKTLMDGQVQKEIVYRNQHVGFAVLHLLMSYFEMITKYEKGDPSDSSRNLFHSGVISVFPEFEQTPDKDRILDILWKQGRNGLFHSGMTQKNLYLRDGDAAIIYEGEAVFIDRFKFPVRIFEHFGRYIAQLKTKSNIDLANNFSRAWDRLHRGKFNQ